ncbi:Hypothetical predicted protein [Octopus vulgaris]|uniref:Uncharacterized protein n=1 Tax=Octopus vulgaris TaxID=6645 RepID=A0AA36F2Z3_OCTVU|nr:Hypothetical predicted protein [Octopus vulgaris]
MSSIRLHSCKRLLFISELQMKTWNGVDYIGTNMLNAVRERHVELEVELQSISENVGKENCVHSEKEYQL